LKKEKKESRQNKCDWVSVRDNTSC